ncbi:MAG: hypothetical protein ABWX88_06440 [Pseudoxanthomonas sp.]
MKIQEAVTKRLLVATLLAIATLGLLGYLASFIDRSGGAGPTLSPGYLDPVDLLVAAVAMCLGGYIEGKRFIGVALAIMCVIWIVTVCLLAQIASPTQPDALHYVFVYNRAQIGLSVLAACTGAAIGAWLRMKRALARPLS